MLRSLRLMSALALGCLAGPAWAEAAVADPQGLPCNALCRRWMGFGAEKTDPETPPAAAERQAVKAPEPVVASPLPAPAPVIARRPRPLPVLRPAAAVPKPPVKPRREPKTLEARHAPLPASAAPDEPAARQPTPPAAAVTVARTAPILAPPRPVPTAQAAAMAPVEVAVAAPIALAARTPAPATPAILVVLPPLEQPPAPVILPPARADALPPAFDVIATLLLTAPPRR